MTREQALRQLATLAAAYPAKQLPEPTLELYAEALAEMSEGTGRETVREIIRTSKFFPSIAELLETASLVREQAVERELVSRPVAEFVGETVAALPGRQEQVGFEGLTHIREVLAKHPRLNVSEKLRTPMTELRCPYCRWEDGEVRCDRPIEAHS